MRMALAMKTPTLGLAFVVLAAFSLMGFGCWDKPATESVKMYSSVEECKADRSESECTQAQEGAQQEMDTTAPHLTYDSCINQYGQNACVARNDYFVPVMTGFMLGTVAGSYHPVYVDIHGSAYYRGAVIGSYYPGCYGCAHTTTVIHVSPSNSGWASSYSRAPLTAQQAAAKPAPPPAVASQRGGFGTKASVGASPTTPMGTTGGSAARPQTFAPPPSPSGSATTSTPGARPQTFAPPPAPSSSSTPAPAVHASPPPSAPVSRPEQARGGGSPGGSSSRGGFGKK